MTGQRAPVLTVGGIQSAVSGETDDNLDHLRTLVAQAGEIDIAITPELSAHSYHFGNNGEWPALDADDPQLHHRPGNAMAVGVGFAGRRPNGGLHNTYAVIGAGRSNLQHKLHPVTYAPWDEHLRFTAGTELRTFELGGANPGRGVERASDVIAGHIARLLGCYVVIVNRCGVDQGTVFRGGSPIVDPHGTPLVQLGQHENTTRVEPDLATVRAVRQARLFHTEINPAYLCAALLAGTGRTWVILIRWQEG